MTDIRYLFNLMTSGSGIESAGAQAQVLEPLGLRRIRIVGLIGLLLTFLLLAVTGTERVREGLFDVYQRLMPHESDRIYTRIVEIDEASLDAYGPWPWPRFLLADLALEISRKGALAIGFDIIFPEPDRYGAARFLESYGAVPEQLESSLLSLPDPDRVFARTISRLPVVLGRSGVFDQGYAGINDPSRLYVEADFLGDPLPEHVLSFPAVVANVDVLDQHAAGQGIINATPDRNGIIRRVPLLAKIGEQATPALSLELLRVAAGSVSYALESGQSGLAAITLSDRRIPTEPDGRLRLHFSPPLASRIVSAKAVLDGSVLDNVFAGTIVIVGASALGLEDIVSTPVAAESLGADVHAQTIDTIIDGSWLLRPFFMEGVEWIVAIVFGLAAVIFFPRMSPRQALICALGMGILVAGASVLSFAEFSLLFDPTVPLLGGGIPALLTLSMMHLEADKRRRALRLALIDERLAAAQVSAELEVARDIQIRMLPNPDSLKALSPAVDLAVNLETARVVGGDLYDAFLLDDSRMFFMIGDVAGKGVPAALFMALSKALTKGAVLRRTDGLATVIRAVNEEISRENPGDFFVSAVLGILHLGSGEVELFNAGHMDPSLISKEGACRRVKMEGGPPLCVIPDYEYPSEPIRMEPGDALVLATDGVTEAANAEGVLFGSKRLEELLGRVETPRTAARIIESVMAAVRAYRQDTEPSDDLTILVVRYLGPDL